MLFRSRAELEPGAIVVMHDTLIVAAGDTAAPSYDRVAMVEAALDCAAERGLRSVSVAALLAAGRAQRTVWFRA